MLPAQGEALAAVVAEMLRTSNERLEEVILIFKTCDVIMVLQERREWLGAYAAEVCMPNQNQILKTIYEKD